MSICSSNSKGIFYYSDNKLDKRLMTAVQKQIYNINLPVTSVTLEPIDFGRNIVISGSRSHATMYRQILAGLENMVEDIVYLCEHDVFYHPDHFAFTPEDDSFYYNQNYWFVRLPDGLAIHYDVTPLSGLVMYRESAIKHFTERVEMIDREGFTYRMGFEPFTHRRIRWKFWRKAKTFSAENPNVDICHGSNSTRKRWRLSDFTRRQPLNWKEGKFQDLWAWELWRKS